MRCRPRSRVYPRSALKCAPSRVKPNCVDPSRSAAVPDQRCTAARRTASGTREECRYFTTARRGSTKGKPPGGDPAAPVRRRSCRGAGSATAVAPAEPAAVSFVAAELAPLPPRQAAQYRKAPFLILVKALVQRICGVGQFLQGRAGLRQGCGALTQPLDRIIGRRSIAHRGPALDTHLGPIARRLLEGRPVLLLLRRQRQTRLERRESRLAERAQVVGAELPSLLHHSVAVTALLRVDERRSRDSERCRPCDNRFPHDTCPFPRHPTDGSTKLGNGCIKLKFS